MKKNLLNYLMVFTVLLFAQAIYAQIGLEGVVKDSDTRETLIGSTLLLEGTSIGSAIGFIFVQESVSLI